MRLTRKRVILVLMFILLGLVVSGSLWVWQRTAPIKPDPIPPGDYSYTVDYPEYRIHQLMRQHHLPSVAVAVIDDQNTVWQGAFGLANVEKEIPATVDMVYKLWSVSKIFTANETMQLADQ